MNRFLATSILLFASIALAAPGQKSEDTYAYPVNGICTDYTITETVSYVKRSWVAPKPETNFDFAALRISEVTLEGAETFHPLGPPENTTDTYKLSATFCTPKKKGGKETTVLVATHGAAYDRRYWASTYKPDEYNFVQYALNSGYSVLYYDRLGTGKSQIPSGFDLQGANQVELVARIAQQVRAGKYTSDIQANKVVLVGHSFGSILSIGAVAAYPEIAEAVILTGSALPNGTDPALILGPVFLTFCNAQLANTLGFARDSGYTAFGDIYAHAAAFFHAPYDTSTVKYAQKISQPLGIVETLSAGTVNLSAPDYHGSVLLTTGEWDALVCGGHCKPRYDYGMQNQTFSGAKGPVETYLHPEAGHGVNFANNATGFYGRIIDFLERRI